MKYGKTKMHRKHTALDGLFRYAEFLNFGEVHVKFDHATGLKAIVAVHNLKRGPAIGGARLVHYPSADAALEDVLRLAYMMSLKAAMADLSHGGAKAVLIAPKVIRDRKKYIESFADFVQVLGGRYVTAIDSGTTREDMDIVKTRTSFVTCTTEHGESGDASYNTAVGVMRGIEACVKFKLNRDNLNGIHVAIQGAGHVGFYLARLLSEQGARITITDIHPGKLAPVANLFNTETCAPDDIYDISADVFAPCALGSVLNPQTIKCLKATIVAGSANNQLSHHHHSYMMQELGILYAPDFVINAGGLIFAAAMYDHSDLEKSKEHVDRIYQTTMHILEESTKKNRTPLEIAEEIAVARLR